MYLAIDVGGTKTLVAALNNDGVIQESFKFPTPKVYATFIKELAENVDKLSTKTFVAAGIGIPGKINREKWLGVAMGNLPWKNVPIKADVTRITSVPTVLENDANLAGLSEAMLLKQYDCVLYVTIGTGIGTGIITEQTINPDFADTEGGKMPIEHQGTFAAWENFASGRAILHHFGKRASEITDKKSWIEISHNLAVGLIDLIAMIQPDVIVLGGGISKYYDQFSKPLREELKKYETPLIPIPPIRQAQRPDNAVLYGAYDLAKATYGKNH